MSKILLKPLQKVIDLFEHLGRYCDLIANILGVGGLDDSSMDSFKTHELKTKKPSEKQVANNNETKDLSSKNHFKRDVPIASISFPHGSSKLTNKDGL